MIMMFANSILFATLSNPLLMTLSLILQIVLMSLTLNLHLDTPWYPIIISLITIGGALIIFLYLSTLGPNITMQPEKIKWFLLIPLNLLPLLTLNPSPPTLPTTNPSIMLSSNYLSLPLLLMLIVIMTLMSSSMILSNMKSPLRSTSK
uniref:NADH dehydrogenase subunit 6 n=1 Tax=Armillifer agkistrodontis TaxID=592791 RepID=A0A1J0CYI7_ARMAG|nr:NADH dehydrogenase subunit 6 [Armillifer agkistrodontis]APB92075.1 NADH dehydrogenase subunit 6 [Armillifer agkistrodontis]